MPWLCVRDFNEIVLVDEKVGGNTHPDWQMVQFCEVIDECGLREIL